MSFGQQAAAFAELGLVPIPVRGKVPCVRGFNRWSVPPRGDRLERLLTTFGDANIGILLRPSRLVVVDVDREDHLHKALDRFGDSPVKARTGRGFHLYFRARGDERSINLRTLGIEADFKVNGYVVAPKSIHPDTGKPYHWLEGGPELLEPDNDRLPRIPRVALEGPSKPLRTAHIREGKRERSLFDHLRTWAASTGVCDLDAIMVEGCGWNAQHAVPPLPEYEVAKAAGSVARYMAEGRCFTPGQGAAVVTSQEELVRFAGNGDALMLWHVLRMNHAARPEPFAIIPEAMADAGVIEGWTKHRYRAKRDDLLDLGYLEKVIQGHSRGNPSLYRLKA